MALAADDLDERYTFRLQPDGSGKGVGADGRTHARFRTWKEALLRSPAEDTRRD
jgi:hypothetical protein